MELGLIGLGRMGSNMTLRLVKGGHRVVVYDSWDMSIREMVRQGATGASSVENLVSQLAKPRIVWLMLPAGEATETTIIELTGLLDRNDMIIDGGNSNYKDSLRRATEVENKGKYFMDVGTSGGIRGLKEGYCLMVGGREEGYERIRPILQTLAPSATTGYGHVGPSGAGHFVKMVHNGIEYGLMEAYAEGFELMQAKKEFSLDLAQVSELWRHGSVVRSWLLDLAAVALRQTTALGDVSAYVEDSGEGRWTVQESVDLAVPIPAIASALQARFRSRQKEPLGPKLQAAMRNLFGGHPVSLRADIPDARGRIPAKSQPPSAHHEG
ncbi:MAG: decarboxylating 6-phosphogluconate dehydrogenase [Chloroflexi bacterium]|nr:decarboxylating 6-phosphogluconate dehydrogenase [Chloroflexota bacterium]